MTLSKIILLREQSIKQPNKDIDISEQIKFYEEQLKTLYKQQIKQYDNTFKQTPPQKKKLVKRIIPAQTTNSFITTDDDNSENFDLDAYFA